MTPGSGHGCDARSRPMTPGHYRAQAPQRLWSTIPAQVPRRRRVDPAPGRTASSLHASCTATPARSAAVRMYRTAARSAYCQEVVGLPPGDIIEQVRLDSAMRRRGRSARRGPALRPGRAGDCGVLAPGGRRPRSASRGAAAGGKADVLGAGEGSRAARAVVFAVVLRQPACGVPRLSD